MNRRHFVGISLGTLLSAGCSRVNLQDAIFSQHLSDAASQVEQPKTIVVQSTTLLLSEKGTEWKTPADVRSVDPNIQESTASALLSVGNERQHVSLMSENLPHKLLLVYVTEEHVREIFETESLTRGWQQFYLEFPNSIGLLSFSSVGFNSARDQAAFVVSVSCGGLCGSGHLVRMARSPNGWRTEEAKSLWVS